MNRNFLPMLIAMAVTTTCHSTNALDQTPRVIARFDGKTCLVGEKEVACSEAGRLLEATYGSSKDISISVWSEGCGRKAADRVDSVVRLLKSAGYSKFITVGMGQDPRGGSCDR